MMRLSGVEIQLKHCGMEKSKSEHGWPQPPSQDPLSDVAGEREGPENKLLSSF